MPHLYPTGQGFIHEYPTAEIDVDDETAEMLLAYHPPIFSLEPTGWPPESDLADGGFVEETGPQLVTVGENGTELVIPPGATPTAEPAGPADAGPSDSSAKE